MIHLAIVIEHRFVTDRQTDTHTHTERETHDDSMMTTTTA